jgi:uncharacterized protein (DUF58 family)
MDAALVSTAPGALLRRLEWRVQHAAAAPLAGEYRSAFRGRGREFDQVVKYEYGDDIRDLDWNVTARLGEPYRKKFIEERELTIVLLFEDSISLQFGSGRRSKRAALLEMAALFALVSATSRDRVGFWHATPETHVMRPPVRGRTQIVRTAVTLLAQPIPDLCAGGEVDIDWRQLFHAFPRHSLLVWLGDFSPRTMPSAWIGLTRRYHVIGVRVEDAWERSLPAQGLLSTVDPLSNVVVPVDLEASANRQRHAEWVRERDRFFKELFPLSTDAFTVSPDDDLLGALIRFFEVRMQRVKR